MNASSQERPNTCWLIPNPPIHNAAPMVIKTAGNFITTQATAATKASGQTPIVAGWDYLQLADRDLDNGKVNVQVTVPKSGAERGRSSRRDCANVASSSWATNPTRT